MRRAICPGTFDPITNGHVDIIKRASNIFDSIIVAVVKHPNKEPLFSYKERLDLVKKTTKGIKNVKVEGFDGLVVKLAKNKKAKVIIRGLRMISDFEYEFQMALTNRDLAPGVETLFLMPHPQYSFVSSKLIKEAGVLGANLKNFLSGPVIKALRKKLNENRSRKTTR